MKLLRTKYFATNLVNNNYRVNPGDMVFAQRGVYQHYGIVSEVDPKTGRPIKVIEYQTPEKLNSISKLNPMNSRVTESSYNSFQNGSNVYHVEDEVGTKFKGQRAVRRARIAMDMANNPKSVFSNYNLAENNCEHFATFIKNGRQGRNSRQVNTILNNVSINPLRTAAGITRISGALGSHNYDSLDKTLTKRGENNKKIFSKIMNRGGFLDHILPHFK
jgi:hypothetical protein